MEHGLVYRNPDSRWEVPLELSSRRISHDGRFESHKCSHNSYGVIHAAFKSRNGECGRIEMLSLAGFFPFLLAVTSGRRKQDYFTVVTVMGLCTATRVIMGSTDAEQVMKAVLGNGVQVWLDDVLGYSDTDSNCWIR